MKSINYLKNIQILNGLILEATRNEVMRKVYNIPGEYADEIEEIAGKLSLFFVKKIKEQYERDVPDSLDSGDNIFDDMIFDGYLRLRLEELRVLMEYLRVKRSGSLGDMEAMGFSEMVDVAERWADRVRGGDKDSGEGNVVLDFRVNGEGYYWVNLGTDYCEQEGSRMRHCGRVFGRTMELHGGSLYSLRRSVRTDDGFKNTTHLTAGITNKGELRGLAGFANSKPKEKYHDYILALLLHVVDGEYLIKSISYEVPVNFFNVNDFNNGRLKALSEKRKDLFKDRKVFKYLVDRDIVDDSFLIMKHRVESSELREVIEFNDVYNRLGEFISSSLNDNWFSYYNFDIRMPFNVFADDYFYDETKGAIEQKFGDKFENLIARNKDVIELIKWAMVSLIPNKMRDVFVGALVDCLKAYGYVEGHDDYGFDIEIDLRGQDYKDYFYDGGENWGWEMIVDVTNKPEFPGYMDIYDGKNIKFIEFFNQKLLSKI